MSLEHESVPTSGALGRAVFDSLCEGLPQMLTYGGMRSLPALQLLAVLAYGMPAQDNWAPRERAARAVVDSFVQLRVLSKNSPASDVQVVLFLCLHVCV
jgi:hypothetical protein